MVEDKHTVDLLDYVTNLSPFYIYGLMGDSQRGQCQQAGVTEQRLMDHKSGQEVLEERVDDKDLQAIAPEVAPKWKLVAQKLGLTPAKIYEIEADNFGPTGGVLEATLKMLQTWRNMHGDDAKKGVLYKALKEAGLKEVGDALKGSNR